MRKLILWLLVLALVVAPVALAVGAFQPQPILPASAALTPAQAAQSRDLIRDLRAAAQGTGPAEVTATRADLDALIATAARALPGLRGRTVIAPEGVAAALSVPAPGPLAAAGWVNVLVEFAPSEGEPDLRRLKVGAVEIPPALALPLLRTALNLGSGDDLGSLLLGSVAHLRTDPDRLRLALAPTADGASLFDRVASGVRGAIGTGDGAAVAQAFAAMSDAAAAGRLPATGSAAPWLAFAADHAAQSGDLRAALLALAAHCGARAPIATLAGDLPDGRSACEGTTLGGRRDLRQHFTLSAGLHAAGGAALSFGFGEVKELVDAGRQGGSGYSFDDIAADRAGIAWAERLAADPAPPATASADEAALMPRITDLPSLMTEAEFARRYDAVDSPAYRDQIAAIDARIAALPFHAR